MEGMKVDAFARNIQLQHSPNLPMGRLKAGNVGRLAWQVIVPSLEWAPISLRIGGWEFRGWPCRVPHEPDIDPTWAKAVASHRSPKAFGFLV